MLALVRLCEGDQQLGRVVALFGGDGLASLDSIEDAGPVFLLQRRVRAVDLAGCRERACGTRKVTGELPRRGLVAHEADAPPGILLELELGGVEGDGALPFLRLLVELARIVDGVRARRVELDCLLVVLDRLLRLRERCFRPEATELLVHAGELAPKLGALRGERREGLRPTIEESDERLRVALVTVELCETLGRDLSGRVLVDRHHEDARRPVRIPERRRPDVRGLGEPVGRVGGIARLRAHALEQHGVGLGVLLACLVRVAQRFFVVRILDEALDEPVDFGAVHSRGGYHGAPKQRH